MKALPRERIQTDVIAPRVSRAGIFFPPRNTSKPITTATTYTLTCLDFSGGTQQTTAVVNILPVFQEQ